MSEEKPGLGLWRRIFHGSWATFCLKQSLGQETVWQCIVDMAIYIYTLSTPLVERPLRGGELNVINDRYVV